MEKNTLKNSIKDFFNEPSYAHHIIENDLKRIRNTAEYTDRLLETIPDIQQKHPSTRFTRSWIYSFILILVITAITASALLYQQQHKSGEQAFQNKPEQKSLPKAKVLLPDKIIASASEATDFLAKQSAFFEGEGISYYREVTYRTEKDGVRRFNNSIEIAAQQSGGAFFTRRETDLKDYTLLELYLYDKLNIYALNYSNSGKIFQKAIGDNRSGRDVCTPVNTEINVPMSAASLRGAIQNQFKSFSSYPVYSLEQRTEEGKEYVVLHADTSGINGMRAITTHYFTRDTFSYIKSVIEYYSDYTLDVTIETFVEDYGIYENTQENFERFFTFKEPLDSSVNIVEKTVRCNEDNYYLQ